MLKSFVILLFMSSTSIVTYTAGGPESCKAEESWQKRNNVYGCYCKDPYKITSLDQVKPDLTCNPEDMTAVFHKCQFNDVNIYFNETHVKDYVYYKFDDNNVTNRFTIIARLKLIHSGGMTYEINKTHVTYKTNFVIAAVQPNSTIQRNGTFGIFLQCTYELDMVTSLQNTLHPFIRAINITVPGQGKFEAYMALFQDSNYINPYSANTDVTLSTEEFLYVGVFYLGGTPNLVLVMINCYATPSKNRDDPLKYYIIQNSCLNKKDGTITVPENGQSDKGRFSVQMFKFVGDYDEVYLHCAVKLCDSNAGSCRPVCPPSARGSRSDAIEISDSTGSFTIGPIKRSAVSGASTINSAHLFWTLLISALIILKQSL